MLTLVILLHIYFVSFLDKPEKTAPQLSPRAVEQRARWGIPTDQMDYPVSPNYQNQLVKMGVKIHHRSRWFNGVTCEMDEETAAKVAKLKFVTDVEMTREDKTGDKESGISQRKHQRAYEQTVQEKTELVTDPQFGLINLLPLHKAGYEGQGILMTICDGGFYRADTMSCFRQQHELGHFDFTDDADGFYGETGSHGTECLSTISGILVDDYYGAATKADYYLMRTEETDTESPKEMDNLIAALEKSDSLGVNIFSVSLGYYYFDNPEWDIPQSSLDGKSNRASLAATIAARKGMLVCVAAGNEGDKNWHTIGVPADADSILSVGAVDVNGAIGNFSSYGPSADGRIKPEVCAVGVNASVISPYGFSIYGNGTSFATPQIAGLAACLWSALPSENNIQILNRILQSSDHYSNPDVIQNQYGYGIPDGWKAYGQGQGLQVTGNEVSNDQPQKIIRGDQILIIRHGHIYNLAGQRIE